MFPHLDMSKQKQRYLLLELLGSSSHKKPENMVECEETFQEPHWVTLWHSKSPLALRSQMRKQSLNLGCYLNSNINFLFWWFRAKTDILTVFWHFVSKCYYEHEDFWLFQWPLYSNHEAVWVECLTPEWSRNTSRGVENGSRESQSCWAGTLLACLPTPFYFLYDPVSPYWPILFSPLAPLLFHSRAVSTPLGEKKKRCYYNYHLLCRILYSKGPQGHPGRIR